MTATFKTVAVFNASDDTVEMLTVALSERGYRVVAGEVDKVKSGDLDFIAFVEQHQPDAIIWDVAPPYDRNWKFFKLLRSSVAVQQRPIVLTTTNKARLDELTARAPEAIELVGKPYDIHLIVDRVELLLEQAARQGPRAVGQ